MTRINIPSQVFPGFKTISNLDNGQVEVLIRYISDLPLDIEFTDVAEKFNQLLKIDNGRKLLQTFLSFSKLSEENDPSNDKLASNLTASFLELSGEQFTPKKKKALKQNLQSILNNYSGIRTIIAARKVLTGNGNNIEEFTLSADIRLLFNEKENERVRPAIIFHRLNIEYSRTESIKEICFSLDIEELKKMKIEIDKAIKNDQIIREDYKEILHFIF